MGATTTIWGLGASLIRDFPNPKLQTQRDSEEYAMIYRDNFRILSDKEKAQYKFEFCQGCALYDECELVDEYAQFRDNHPQIHKPKTSQFSGERPVVRATVVGYESTPTIDTGKDRLEYNKCADEILKNGCIMSSRHVYPIACDRKRVSDGIGDHYKIEAQLDSSIRTETSDRWEPLQPVFISAQTGQGKNYFVEHELIPYVRELNYKNNTEQRVLILSNRLALQQQIKSRLEGDYDTDDETYKIYPYKEFANVMTYQSLLWQEKRLENIQKKARSRYIYVICDEAHFFTSDAMFNPHTAKILEAIVRLFQDAIRVYMSATPYECLEHIIRYEEEYKRLYLNWGKPQRGWAEEKMVLYHFKRDYSYLDIKIYSEFEELYEQILDSVNRRKKKWLIFIDDRERGSTVGADLLKYAKKHSENLDENHNLEGGERNKKIIVAEHIQVVNADSKDDPTYMSIVLNEALVNGICVLITTSVLDNGVNLRNIDNIIVSDMSKVKCLQMLGRARIDGADDRKTLYIKRFDLKYVNRRIDALREQEDAYHSYELAYGEFRDPLQSRGTGVVYNFLNKYYDGNESDWTNAKHWFGRSLDKPTELYPNEIAKSLLNRIAPQYLSIREEIIDEMSQVGIEQREGKKYPGQKFLEYQLSWFGRVYCKDDDVTFADRDKVKKAFIAFLKAYADSGETVDGKEKMAEFQTEFKRLHDAVYPSVVKDKTHPYGYKKMNDILKNHNLGYEIVGQPQKGPWTVIRVDANHE